MRFLDKLERKYGRFAIPNLMQYIIVGMVIVLLFGAINQSITGYLGFSLTYILRGQFWRIITFVLLPGSSGIWVIFYFMILYFFSRILESYWGSFRFNLYILIGCLGTIMANILLEVMYGTAVPLSNFYLYTTLMLAVSRVAPDYEIRIYFVLPVKLKYLGYIYGGFLLVQLLFGNLQDRIIILFGVLNFLLFFGPELLRKNKANVRRAQYVNQQKAKPKTKIKTGEVIQVAFHCCEVCGKTEVDDPTLEFRYCSKCDGHHEYCSAHIMNHDHIKE